MNILIADDEPMVRFTLISMLHELDLNITEIREVDNGERLLKALGEFSPEIAFVDIKMPKLDGLQAIGLARELSPRTKWIILTGFSEFEFAKQAIELGVSKYLLKPVSPQTLHDTIQLLMKDNTTHYYNENKRFERDIIALYNQFDAVQDKLLEDSITKSIFEPAVLYIDNCLGTAAPNEPKKRFFAELYLLIDGLLSQNLRIALFHITATQVATVCATDTKTSPTANSRMDSYFTRIGELIAKYSGHQLQMTLLKSRRLSSFQLLNPTFASLNQLAPLRVLYGTGCIHPVETFTPLITQNEACLEFARLILALTLFYSERKYLSYHSTIQRLTEMLLQSSVALDLNMQKNVSNYLAATLHFETPLANNYQDWLAGLNQHGEKLLTDMEQNSNDYIGQVIDFIQENYMHDIGLGTIATALQITPNYLSSLFHKITHRKFIDYLTELRILKAKELLGNQRHSIEEISQIVGYHSVRHFTKLFVKYTHQYPSEYRRSLKT